MSLYVCIYVHVGSAPCCLHVVQCGGRAESQATPGGRLVGVACAGEGVGSVERVCEGEAGEERAGQSDQGDEEGAKVSGANPYDFYTLQFVA